MEYATAQDLLSATERRYKEVAIQGKMYRLRSITEGERYPLELLLSSDDPEEKKLFKATLLSLLWVDENDNLILTPGQAQDLLDVDAAYIALLTAAAFELVGFDEDDIEEAEKN